MAVKVMTPEWLLIGFIELVLPQVGLVGVFHTQWAQAIL